MTKLPVISSKEVIKALRSAGGGFEDAPIFLSSLDQAGLTKDEFIDLLKK
jgi:hypothetical protein